MVEFDSFRGYDLRERKARIRNTMNMVAPKSPQDVPVMAQTPCYFGFGNHKRDIRYWQEPAEMLRFQQDGFEQHLKHVDDDTVPYFMPWFGTGVLASAFGCTVKPATGDGDDPGIATTAVENVEDIAHLKLPDPHADGEMPKVLRFMEYAARHGEMPVGYTDLNSPLCTAAQICGYDKLFYWMYDEPAAVHELMTMICESFAGWVDEQRKITGEPFGQANGLQGVWTPKGGVWMSDDDLVSVNSEMYEEFVVPYYSRIFPRFGGGHLHYCGVGTHQLENILSIPGVTAVNNSPMGNKAAFDALVTTLGGKRVIELQDAAPAQPEAYYSKLFSGLEDMTGIMVTTFVEDRLASDLDGRTIFIDRENSFEAANAVVRAVRGAAARVIGSGA